MHRPIPITYEPYGHSLWCGYGYAQELSSRTFLLCRPIWQLQIVLSFKFNRRKLEVTRPVQIFPGTRLYRTPFCGVRNACKACTGISLPLHPEVQNEAAPFKSAIFNFLSVGLLCICLSSTIQIMVSCLQKEKQAN